MSDKDIKIWMLQIVCAEAYQMAGALNASEKALDNLLAAANGEDELPHATFLPHESIEEVIHSELTKMAAEFRSRVKNGTYLAMLEYADKQLARMK